MLSKFIAFQRAKEFHWACKRLRISKLLHDQLFRASSSVALNLAEGAGKRTLADQRRHYSIALGSLREAQAILELEAINDLETARCANELGAMLFTLIRPDDN